MSASASKDYVNDLNESDFPFLSAKVSGKRAVKGRRNGAEVEFGRSRAGGATLTKSIEDPAGLLGKKCKARLLSECLDTYTSGVAYSLNRKNRWAEVNTSALLKSSNTSDVESQVVERVFTAKNHCLNWTNYNVIAVHSLDNQDTLKTLTAGGKGTNLVSLTTPPREKQRGCRAKREIAAKKASELMDLSGTRILENPERPKIQYNICKAHPSPKVFSGKLHGKSTMPKAKRVRVKQIDLNDLETSEMENSVHIEDNDGYKPSRDFRFCLGDYMVEKNSAPVYVRRQSIESVKQATDMEKEEPMDCRKPLDLLDISAILRNPVTFEWLNMDSFGWTDFNFVQQVNDLMLDPELIIHWLNDSCRRVSIDATSKVTKVDSNPILVIVFEECRRKTCSYARLLLNSFIVPNINRGFCWRSLKHTLLNAKVANLSDTVNVVCQLVKQWHFDQSMSSIDASDSRFITRRNAFQPCFNSQIFKRTAKVISEGQMAEILGKECKNVQSDPFELIEHEHLDFCEKDDFSEYSQLEITSFPPMTVKCQTCVNSCEDDLFELDDCWKCRKCLKQYIISQIRIRNIPIEIPFVLNQGQSLYNMLTAIIPLPLISFYTKAAATDLLKCSAIGDLIECPACKKVVLVERPNEYNCCCCSSCDAHWCSECNFEPHWPMSCSQFKVWTEKWDKQYPYDAFGENVVANIQHVDCYFCGELVCEIDGKRLKCNCRIYPCPPPNVLTFPKTIKKDIAELCSSAHSIRFDLSGKKRFELKVRKVKKTVPIVEKLIDMRTTILFVVENGLAWCYLEKAHLNSTAIKANLIRLMKQLEDTEICMETPRFNGEKVESLEINLNKVIDLLKKNI